MKDVLTQFNEWIKVITQVGLGLVALGVVVEIVFGKGAIFGKSVVANMTEIVGDIGGEEGFVGLIAILIIMGIFLKRT